MIANLFKGDIILKWKTSFWNILTSQQWGKFMRKDNWVFISEN